MSQPTFYDKAISPEFWLDLNPGMHITERGTTKKWKALETNDVLLQELKYDMVEDGYFATEPLFDLDEMERLADVVEKLWCEQWPTVFAMVYDEFWQVYQRSANILNYILGPYYRQLPNYWVYYVNNDKGSSGWAPHRDRAAVKTIREDGLPNSMTIWIALTDSTPYNGCMYVLPAGHDPNYPESPWTFEVPKLQTVRALPCQAGSILSWNESLIHWGSASSDKGVLPRISAACAFQRKDVAPLETPLLDPFAPPDFKTRLGLIGQQLYRFAIHTGMPHQVKELANELGKLSETIVIYDAKNPYKPPSDKKTRASAR